MMSDNTKDQFALGDWHVGHPDGKTPLRVYTRSGSLIADCDGGGPYDANGANAKLIAAAPDLLAALVLCVEDYEDGLIETDAWQMLHIGKVERPPTPSHIMHARAAIDKARNG